MDAKEIHEQTANDLMELEEKIHEIERKTFLESIDAESPEVKAAYRERSFAYSEIRGMINKQIRYVVTGRDDYK